MQVFNTILNNILKEMYDAKGIILKQKKLSMAYDHIKSYSNISRFKSIFCKRTVPKLSKDKFCNLECLVCHKLYRKKKSQCNMIYFTAHSSNIPKIM